MPEEEWQGETAATALDERLAVLESARLPLLDVVLPLLRLARDGDAGARARAATQLAGMQHPRGLLACLADIEEAAGARLTEEAPTIRALGEMRLRAIPALLRLLVHEDAAVRRHAERAMRHALALLHGHRGREAAPNAEAEERVKALWRANGDYTADASAPEREAAVAQWRAWAAQLELTPDPGASSASGGPEVAFLERQVERGSLFTHSALAESYTRLGELQVLVHALADSLFQRNIVNEAEMAETMQTVRSELLERGELSGPGTALRVDSPEPPVDAVVDCSARIGVCKAVCCKLNFALSAVEIEDGRAKWDLGRPYFIRQSSTGYCTHCTGDLRCAIHEARPRVCRSYSCATDTRIWKDFGAMELNTEWLEANLRGSEHGRVRLVLMDGRAVHR